MCSDLFSYQREKIVKQELSSNGKKLNGICNKKESMRKAKVNETVKVWLVKQAFLECLSFRL